MVFLCYFIYRRETIIEEMGMMCEELRDRTIPDDISSSFSILSNWLGTQFLTTLNLGDVPDPVKQQIKGEIQHYNETGCWRIGNETATVCVNPTLLDPTTRRWEIDSSRCPLYGYAPQTREELKALVNEGKLICLSQKMLKNLISSFQRRIKDIKLYFHLEDPLQFCYSSRLEDKFDVVDCSYLPDVVGLANIVNACSVKLADNQEARLFTEIQNWEDVDAGSVQRYIEIALCSPWSMIPTIYGMRLVENIELGLSTLPNIHRAINPVHLCWQRVPQPRNLAFSASPALHSCLQQLCDQCYDMVVPRDDVGLLPGDTCGMLSYSPLTLHYVMNSMNQRLGKDIFFKNGMQLEIPAHFNLASITMDAWRNGQAVVKFSVRTPPYNRSFDEMYSTFGVPQLRMMLAPPNPPEDETGEDSFDFSGPNVHYIDNFHLEMEKTVDNKIGCINVSFYVAMDQGLEDTHHALILENWNGVTVFDLGPMKSMQSEEVQMQYPFPAKPPLLPAPSKNFHMAVERCVECEEKYLITIKIHCDIEVSGNFIIDFNLLFHLPTCISIRFKADCKST